MDWFAGFEAAEHAVNGTRLYARTGGRRGAPPLVLLHGFPQTHALWHRVAQQLARDHALVLPDLRGYGRSAKPSGGGDHADYAKRTMAADVHALMRALGHARYAVAGHDRGGRVAHRLALDEPQAVTRLAVLDIVPTLAMYECSSQAFASAYYHWYFLIQPEPLPERLIGADAQWVLRQFLGGWGARGLAHIEPEALADYAAAWCTPEGVHASCEDYRAAATIDLVHDRASRAAGERIACDLLVLWGARGVVGRLFDPLAEWRACCHGAVEGQALAAGHFLAEEQPERTAAQLRAFFAA